MESRYGKVLKTVAYIAIDEDEYGNPVVEKWDIKKYRKYSKTMASMKWLDKLLLLY